MWLASVPHLLFSGAGKTEKFNGGVKKKNQRMQKKIQGKRREKSMLRKAKVTSIYEDPGIRRGSNNHSRPQAQEHFTDVNNN